MKESLIIKEFKLSMDNIKSLSTQITDVGNLEDRLFVMDSVVDELKC